MNNKTPNPTRARINVLNGAQNEEIYIEADEIPILTERLSAIEVQIFNQRKLNAAQTGQPKRAKKNSFLNRKRKRELYLDTNEIVPA